MSFTNGQMLQAIGPNQCQSITASALGTLLSGLVTPAAHATTHKSGGSDAIKLDELAAPTDVTTLNVSTSAHGLCPKAPNSTAQVLRGDGAFGTPVVFTGDSGSGGAVGAVPAPAAGDAAASKFLKADGTWALAGAGTVTSVTGTAPIVSSGGTTPAISINDATATVRGAVPTPPNDGTQFLAGDATWKTPASSKIKYSKTTGSVGPTIGSSDNFTFFDLVPTGGVGFTPTLPDAASVGASYTIWVRRGNANGITVSVFSNSLNSDTIDKGNGSLGTSVSLNDNGTVVMLQCTGVSGAGAWKATFFRLQGTDAESVCAGNDSRLSDSRTPTGACGGTDLGGSYPSSLTINNNAVTNAKLAQMAANTIKGNNTAGTANAADLTATQAKALLSITESDVANLTSDLAAKVPTSRNVNTTAPLTGGGDLSADRTLAISNFSGDFGSGGSNGAVPAPATGDAAAKKYLFSDGTWRTPLTSDLSGTIAASQLAASALAAMLSRVCRGA